MFLDTTTSDWPTGHHCGANVTQLPFTQIPKSLKYHDKVLANCNPSEKYDNKSNPSCNLISEC